MGLRPRNVIDLLRSLKFSTDRFSSPTTKESRDPPPLSEKIVSQKIGFGPPFLRHTFGHMEQQLRATPVRERVG